MTKQYNGVICRGSFALGTACGTCEKCREQIDRYRAKQRVDAALNTPALSLKRIKDAEAEIDRLKKAGQELADVMAIIAHRTVHRDVFPRIAAKAIDAWNAAVKGECDD